MKKFSVACAFLALGWMNAQFSVFVEGPAEFPAKEVYLYTLNGSKDVLATKQNKKGNTWQLKVPQSYKGMMKLYFPETNTSVNFISENQDVRLAFAMRNGKIANVDYKDAANSLMNEIQEVQQKKEIILPALYQIKEYYKANSAFGAALDQEINRLSADKMDAGQFPFVTYYTTNYSRFLEKKAGKPEPTRAEIIQFIAGSNEFLETSSLLRPVLVAYLNAGSSSEISKDVDELLAKVNLETPRGQTVISELIDIFDAYGMTEMKERYLAQAADLKCTITDRLAQTIASNKMTQIGATFADYKFSNPAHTTAKSIYDVKADRKVIMFWASTCSHCENDLPVLIEKYNAMKKQKTEIIALSLDSDAAAFNNKVKMLPWINDSELRGWNSTAAEQYNVRATPTYFVLDSNNKIIAKPNRAADVISFLKLN